MIDMERKIGEIFEYNGEWYQCVRGQSGEKCIGCSFKFSSICIYFHCLESERKDHTKVIFKKLEKVGEPYYSKYYGKFYQKYITYIPAVDYNFKLRIEPVEHVSGTEIYVELKQKEDMEEKKLKISFEKADYLINKLQDILADYLHGGESDEVIAKFEELLDMEEKHSNSEKIGKNLKEFDLEAAKLGKPVCTRDGRKTRIICFDKGGEQPIVALIEKNEEESIDTFFSNGHSVSKTNEVAGDLMMLAEKRSGWAKVRKDINLYDTKEEADRKMIGNDEYVTAKVYWEE